MIAIHTIWDQLDFEGPPNHLFARGLAQLAALLESLAWFLPRFGYVKHPVGAEFIDPVLRVDWRPLVATVVRALRSEEEHMLGPSHEQYRTNLVACLGAMRIFIPPSDGPELIAAIWPHADPVRADVVIIAQVLCFVLCFFLTPS